MADEKLSDLVASSVRAELARRRLSAADLASALGIDTRSAQRRLSGQTPFGLDEIASTAVFLEMPIAALLPGVGVGTVAA